MAHYHFEGPEDVKSTWTYSTIADQSQSVHVTDANVVISFDKAGCVDMLPEICAGTLVISEPVFAQCTAFVTGDSRSSAFLSDALNVTYSSDCMTATCEAMELSYMDVVDAGVIGLASWIPGAELLSNDHQVRQVAKTNGISVCGTEGLLKRAFDQSLISITETKAIHSRMVSFGERLLFHAEDAFEGYLLS